MSQGSRTMSGKREFGDYQTPLPFTEKVCTYLKENYKLHPSVVIEPTCGLGNFLKTSLVFGADEYYGIEINKDYCTKCKELINDERVHIINSDFFSFSSKDLIKNKREILIIGNPPWVTNSTLSILDSKNLPDKTNFKGFKGIEAITGASNFDICEYIILQLINEYSNTNTFISMLCKTSVARNVFKEIKRKNINFSLFDVLEFDASKVFDISVSACVLVIHLSETPCSLDVCNVYEFENPKTVKNKFGYSNGNFYSDIRDDDDEFDGSCCFQWRQGVKHDCSKVMELSIKDGDLINGNKEYVQIENDLVFPLIKSSMFKNPIVHSFSKYVIVTQKRPREKTDHLQEEVPKTWEYLNKHISDFENRKSSIYKNAPSFSMFGIGDYSFSRYKVGVSGFYKQPMFSVLYSDDGKPVMTDDTSYFICFDDYEMSYVSMLLLNSSKVQSFLKRISFVDSKRPYTIKVLERIDFKKIIKTLSIGDLEDTEFFLGLPHHISISMYNRFKSIVNK